MIVTVDGPAGAGKSTAARALASRLGFDYLDTGAMYRAVALAAQRAGLEPAETPEFERWLATLQLEATPAAIRLDGADVAPLIRTPEITALASRVAAIPAVRRFLVGLQRQAVQGRDIVCDGRDQGTAVFPDAECKFFVTADRVERARRRQRDLQARGEAVALDAVLAAQDERDRRDAERAIGPMIPASDAIILDTTARTIDEVVAHMESIVRQCRPSTP